MVPISVKVYVLVFLFLAAISRLELSDHVVVCYYCSWATYRTGAGKFDVANIEPNLCTHLVYAFAGIDHQGFIVSLDEYLDLPDDWGRDNFANFNALKEVNPELKTLLAVGGWNEGSAKYSVMAANSTLRSNFISSSVKMVRDHGFNGLDVDWEYPNQRDSVHGVEDINNFTQLLKELKEAFDEHGLLLTAAVAAVENSAGISYDIPAISQYLDIVNLMTYDLYGPWDAVTGHNAPLHREKGNINLAEDYHSVDQALDYWITQGCPPEKIAVGIPLYSRSFTLADASLTFVRAPARGEGISGPFTSTEGILGYNEFCDMLRTENWTEEYDALAKVPYAYKNKDWVSYDNVQSVSDKVKYAKNLGVAGAMVWSIETDDFNNICRDGNYRLLRAINNALNSDLEEETLNTTTTMANTVASTTNSPAITSSSLPTTINAGSSTTSSTTETSPTSTIKGSSEDISSTSAVLTSTISSVTLPEDSNTNSGLISKTIASKTSIFCFVITVLVNP